jgi:drug/metabolite transporter (DMT)-like permease
MVLHILVSISIIYDFSQNTQLYNKLSIPTNFNPRILQQNNDPIFSKIIFFTIAIGIIFKLVSLIMMAVTWTYLKGTIPKNDIVILSKKNVKTVYDYKILSIVTTILLAVVCLILFYNYMPETLKNIVKNIFSVFFCLFILILTSYEIVVANNFLSTKRKKLSN